MTTLARPPIALRSPPSFLHHPSSIPSHDTDQPDQVDDRLQEGSRSPPSPPHTAAAMPASPSMPADSHQPQLHNDTVVIATPLDADMEGGAETAGVSPPPWDLAAPAFDPLSRRLAEASLPLQPPPAPWAINNTTHFPPALAAPPDPTMSSQVHAGATIGTTTTDDARRNPQLDEPSSALPIPPPSLNSASTHRRQRSARSPDRSRGHDDDSAEDEDDEDDDDDDDNPDGRSNTDDGDDIARFYPFDEDTTPPDPEELRVIDASDEHSALDDAHWESRTFFDLKDSAVIPVESGIIEWTVESFNGTKDNPRKELLMTSPTISVGGHDWRIKLLPHGHTSTDRVSVYVECVSLQAKPEKEWLEEELPLPPMGPSKLLRRQSVAAQVSVIMYNPEEPRVHEFRSDAHQFQPESPDHGWSRFTATSWYEIHRRAYMARQPLLRNDRLALKAFIRVVHDPTGCMWTHTDADGAEDPVPTTGLQLLPALDDLAVAPVLALWLHLRPFRRVLYLLGDHDLLSHQPAASPPCNTLSMLQAVLYRMRTRRVESGDSRSRAQIHDYIDYCYDTRKDSYDVVQTMDSMLDGLHHQLEELSTSDEPVASAAQAASAELRNLMGFSNLHLSGLRKIKVAVEDKSSIQEALDGAKDGLERLQNPLLLTVELERQVFDRKKRCWKKLMNYVRLDDHICMGQTSYTLYGFATHAGHLQAGKYSSFVRPNGPISNLWYTYRSGHPECLTKEKAVTPREGSTSLKALDEPFSLHDRASYYSDLGHLSSQSEPVAYVVLYIRDDIASQTFYFPFDEAWEVPKWILNDHAECLPPSKDLQLEGDDGSAGATQNPETGPDNLFDGETEDPRDATNHSGHDDTEMGDASTEYGDRSSTVVQTLYTADDDVTETDSCRTVIDYLSQPFYEGQLKNLLHHGQGHLIYLNGDEYTGSFAHGHREGHGTMAYQNGDIYEGSWLQDCHDGYGTYTEKQTGNVYKGAFKDGKKYGAGTTYWKTSEEQSRLCRICFGGEANAAFYDCGHVVACADCARRVEDCPICRRRVRDVLKLYYTA